MKRLLAAAVAAFFVSTVAVQAAEGCRPIETFLDLLASKGIAHEVHKGEPVVKAMAYYNNLPGNSVTGADSLLIATLPNGDLLVAFGHGTEGCEVLRVSGPGSVYAFRRAILGTES